MLRIERSAAEFGAGDGRSNGNVQAFHRGAVAGAASMVDGMVKLISRELGIQVTVVITGGNSGLIRDFLTTEAVYDENLIFNGLKELYLA